jgi:glycerol-3-phosphate acyltransferase PlsX
MERVGVDLISGEADLKELMLGCIDALKEDPYIEVVLLGPRNVYEKVLNDKKHLKLHETTKNFDKLKSRISFIAAPEIITMEDEPLKVIKQKKNSSIIKGLEAHKRMEIDAFFSPGNTGAIVVASAIIMGRVGRIKKPALAAFIPTRSGKINLLLDVGASAECESIDLVRFAGMGRIFCRERLGIASPRVALLNIGSEEHKGNQLMRDTHKTLSNMDINFIGNVEGDDFFKDKTDVVVCDGSLGNTTLKVMEGASSAIMSLLKSSIMQDTMANTLSRSIKEHCPT